MQEDKLHQEGWFMPAEWQRHDATWMVWPHQQALWASYGAPLAQVQREFAQVAQAIARFEPVNMVVSPSAVASARQRCGPDINLLEQKVNDCWCRDSGPTFICYDQRGIAGISWRFNAWGGNRPMISMLHWHSACFIT